ncbi:MAG: hypothetical protein M0041_04715 [Nitrospiraceae bacterium]|nr:hypothetical protein [Nitrospiraceae bacterium]
MAKLERFKSLKFNGHGRFFLLPAVICMLSFVGCTSMAESPDVALQPSLANGKKLSVEAKAVNGIFSDSIELYVNGTKVGSGVVTMVQGSTKISGNYEGNAIEASCRAVDADSAAGMHECQVYVNGNKATTLHF